MKYKDAQTAFNVKINNTLFSKLTFENSGS